MANEKEQAVLKVLKGSTIPLTGRDVFRKMDRAVAPRSADVNRALQNLVESHAVSKLDGKPPTYRVVAGAGGVSPVGVRDPPLTPRHIPAPRPQSKKFAYSTCGNHDCLTGPAPWDRM